MTRDATQTEATREFPANKASAYPVAAREREWLSDIECLKGFAIFTVVLGHVYDPNFPAWALDLRHAIYAFHMPLFMFLSGYVFIHVGGDHPKGSLYNYVKKRSLRLLLPFLAMAIIVVSGKLVAGIFLKIDKPINDVFESISLLFINTEKSPVQFIWYLIVLFYFSVITVFLRTKFSFSLIFIFIISIIIHFIHVILFNNGIVFDFLYFNRILIYYVFFMTGCIAYQNKNVWLLFIDRYWFVAGAFFVAFEYFLFDSEWRYFFVGTAAAFFFHGLVRKFFDGNTVLMFLGRNAFAIYLFNMLFIGLVKGVFGKFIALPSDYAAVVIPLCTIVAIGGAIFIKFAIGRFGKLSSVSKAIE